MLGIDLYWPYLAPLIVVCLLTITTGIGPMLRTAIVLAVNYVVNTWFVLHFQIYDPWYFYLITDSASAFAVLYRPAGRVQSVVGGIYIAQILMHVVYGVSKILHPDVSAERYWEVLTDLGFVQLLILGVWTGVHWGRRAYHHLRGPRPVPAHKHGNMGLA